MSVKCKQQETQTNVNFTMKILFYNNDATQEKNNAFNKFNTDTTPKLKICRIG